MCLMFELLQNIIQKFYSLNYACRTLMKQIMNMTINYIDSIDDENILREVMLEKDFSGRDSLKIAV